MTLWSWQNGSATWSCSQLELSRVPIYVEGMVSAISRARDLEQEAIAQSKSEAARYLLAASVILEDLAAHATNGEKAFYNGMRERLKADRLNLIEEKK